MMKIGRAKNRQHLTSLRRSEPALAHENKRSPWALPSSSGSSTGPGASPVPAVAHDGCWGSGQLPGQARTHCACRLRRQRARAAEESGGQTIGAKPATRGTGGTRSPLSLRVRLRVRRLYRRVRSTVPLTSSRSALLPSSLNPALCWKLEHPLLMNRQAMNKIRD